MFYVFSWFSTDDYAAKTFNTYSFLKWKQKSKWTKNNNIQTDKFKWRNRRRRRRRKKRSSTNNNFMITMLLDESSWYIPATHKIKQATKIPIPWMQIAVDLHTYCCSLDSWYVCVCVFVSMSFVVVVVVCFAFHTSSFAHFWLCSQIDESLYMLTYMLCIFIYGWMYFSFS